MKGMISQAAARRLRKQNHELLKQISQYRNAWLQDYPGIWLASHPADEVTRARLMTARKLDFAVCVQVNNGEIQFYATPLEMK